MSDDDGGHSDGVFDPSSRVWRMGKQDAERSPMGTTESVVRVRQRG